MFIMLLISNKLKIYTGFVKVSAMSYEFIPISLMVIFAYIITYILHNEDEITKATYMKVWNIIILLNSLLLISIGLILTVLIEYGVNSTAAFSILLWHVEVGIALVPITLIHICLYWKSFKKITLGLNGKL